jgi:phytoene synthase
LHFPQPAELVDTLSPAARLALAYAPGAAKPTWLALLALDARLSAILQGRREPIAAQLRLAWWRERLESPPTQWPKGEPLLEALGTWRTPAVLAVLPSGWEALLAEQITRREIEEFAETKAAAFAGLASELGQLADGNCSAAARTWAAADLAAHTSNPAERQIVLDYARALPEPAPLPRALRPLAVLARLGQASLAKGGAPLLDGPASALLALRVGLLGR